MLDDSDRLFIRTVYEQRIEEEKPFDFAIRGVFLHAEQLERQNRNMSIPVYQLEYSRKKIRVTLRRIDGKILASDWMFLRIFNPDPVLLQELGFTHIKVEYRYEPVRNTELIAIG